MLYDCTVPIFLDPGESNKCVGMWQGRHAGWQVTPDCASRMLRFSAEIATYDQRTRGRTTTEGADFYFFVNGSMTALGKFYKSRSFGLVCGDLGPLNAGDYVALHSFPRNTPSVCAKARNFQVCEAIGQCPGVVIEGLDITFCLLFKYMGSIFNDVWQFWEDVGDWFEPMWGVGSQIQSLFYAIGGYFSAASGYMYDIRDWCEMLTKHINSFFDYGVILTYLTDSFAILTYTAGDVVQWIHDGLTESFPILTQSVSEVKADIIEGLEEAFHIKIMWDWITNADEWVKGKIGEGASFTADAIADIFEDILDKVFKR